MTSSFTKKLVAAASAALMLASAAPAMAAAHAEGTNVSKPDGSVCMIRTGQLQCYTSAGAFLSYGFNSWSQVVAANSDDLALPMGSFIAPQDGSVIFSDRGADKGTGYILSGGMKYGFPTEAVFKAQGYSYSTAMWADISWVSMGGTINAGDAAHLPGTLINNGGTVQLVGNSGLMGIPDLATFNSWGYSFAKVVPANANDTAKSQTGVMPTRVAGQLSPTGTTTTTPTPTGPVSVMLSSSNPAAGVIVAGQATAPLLAVTLTGTGTVNSLTLKRTGISDQNTLTNVYLYDGASRLTDGYSFNSTGDLSMNNLGLVVSGSRTLWVKADVYGSAPSGQTIAISVTGITAGTTASTVNVMGNTMTVASGASLATASLSANTVTGTPTINAGTSNYVFWSAPLQVNTRTLSLKGANFRMVGSVPSDAISNIRMYVDGVDAGVMGVVTMANGSNYAMFDFGSAPKSLTTGSHTLDVRGDVQKGSSRNVQFSIQNASDLMIMDPQIGVNIAVSGTIPNNGATISIGTGSLTAVLDPAFQAMTNVTGGASNVAIAKVKFHAYGEDVKINSLQVLPVLTGTTPAASGLQNVTLYFNGTQVGTQQGWTTGNLTFQLGSQLIVPAGQDSTLEVRADLRTTGGVNYTAGTVSANLVVGSSNAQGQNSFNTISTPAISGTSLTIQTGLLAVSKNNGYSSQSINANTAGVKIGSFTLQNQSSSESVRVTSLAVALAFAAPTYTSGTVTAGSQTVTVSSTAGFTVGNVITIPGATPAIGTVTAIPSGTTLTVNFTTGGVTPTAGGAITGSGSTNGPATVTNLAGLRTSETSGNAGTPVQPQATNTFSTDFTLAPGAVKEINILADTSTANLGTVVPTLTVTSIGVTSNVSTTSSAIGGQTMTFASGSLATPTLVTASATTAQYIAAGNGGATDGSKATYNFVSAGGASTISELTFTVSGATTATSVKVGSVTAPVVSGTAYLTGLALAIPNGGSGLTQDVFVSYPEVGTNGIAPGSTSALTLTTIKATSGGTTTTSTVSVAAPTMTLVGSKPTLTLPSTQATGLSISGTTKIGEVTVTADAKGNVKLNDIVFTVSSSGFSTAPTAIGTPVISTNNSASAPVSGATCTPASLVVTCEFGDTSNTNFDGFTVQAGQPVTFSLFGTLTGAAAVGSGTPTITSSIGTSTFNWDDSSTNGASGTNLTGTLLYNFPNNSYSIRQ